MDGEEKVEPVPKTDEGNGEDAETAQDLTVAEESSEDVKLDSDDKKSEESLEEVSKEKPEGEAAKAEGCSKGSSQEDIFHEATDAEVQKQI